MNYDYRAKALVLADGATATDRAYILYDNILGKCVIYPLGGATVGVAPYDQGMKWNPTLRRYRYDYEIIFAGAIVGVGTNPIISGFIPQDDVIVALDQLTLCDYAGVTKGALRWLPLAAQVAPEYYYGVDVIEVATFSEDTGIVFTEGAGGGDTSNGSLTIVKGVQVYPF
ncbi:MAG: hypothetical protein P1V51_20075 [Deltaproteobacteria bacterium]|nr:hypothetical protein [Deltaproteobacteria bacterium]